MAQFQIHGKDRDRMAKTLRKVTGVQVSNQNVLDPMINSGALKLGKKVYDNEEDKKKLEAVVKYTAQSLALQNYFGVREDDIHRFFTTKAGVPTVKIGEDSVHDYYGFRFYGQRKSNKQIFQILPLDELIFLAHPNPTLEERMENPKRYNIVKKRGTIAFNEYEARRIIFQELVSRSDYLEAPELDDYDTEKETEYGQFRGYMQLDHILDVVKIDERTSIRYKKRQNESKFFSWVRRNYDLVNGALQYTDDLQGLKFLEPEIAEVASKFTKQEEREKFEKKLKQIKGEPPENFINSFLEDDIQNEEIDPIVRLTYDQYILDQISHGGQIVNIFSPEETTLRQTIFTILFDNNAYNPNIIKNVDQTERATWRQDNQEEIRKNFDLLCLELEKKIHGTHRANQASEYLKVLSSEIERPSPKYRKRAIVRSNSPIPEVHDAMHGTFCMSNGNPFYGSKYMEIAQFGLLHRLHPSIDILGFIAQYYNKNLRKYQLTPHLAKIITVDSVDLQNEKKYTLVDGVVVPEDVMFLYSDWREYYFDNIFQRAIEQGKDSVLINLQTGESHLSTYDFQEYALKKAIEWSNLIDSGPKYHESDFRFTSRKININGYIQRLISEGNFIDIGPNEEDVRDKAVFSHLVKQAKELDPKIIQRLNRQAFGYGNPTYNYVGQVYLDSFMNWHEKLMLNVDLLADKFITKQFHNLGLKGQKKRMQKLIDSNFQVAEERKKKKDNLRAHLNYGEGGVIAVEIPVAWYLKMQDRKSDEVIEQESIERVKEGFRNGILYNTSLKGPLENSINAKVRKGLNQLRDEIEKKAMDPQGLDELIEDYIEYYAKNDFFGDKRYLRFLDIYSDIPDRRKEKNPRESFKEFILSIMGVGEKRKKLYLMDKKTLTDHKEADLYIVPEDIPFLSRRFERINKELISIKDGFIGSGTYRNRLASFLVNKLEEEYVGKGFLIPFPNIRKIIREVTSYYDKVKPELKDKIQIAVDKLEKDSPGKDHSLEKRVSYRGFSTDDDNIDALPKNINYLLSFVDPLANTIPQYSESLNSYLEFVEKIRKIAKIDYPGIYLKDGYRTDLTDEQYGFRLLNEQGFLETPEGPQVTKIGNALRRQKNESQPSIRSVADLIKFTVEGLPNYEGRKLKSERVLDFNEAFFRLFESQRRGLGEKSIKYIKNFITRVEGFNEYRIAYQGAN